jgi:hypothetical protein
MGPPTELIMDRLKRKLREVGPACWEPIAAACGVAKTLPRKIVYGDRENPGVQTVQPLISFFEEVEAGVRDLPSPSPADVPEHHHADH